MQRVTEDWLRNAHLADPLILPHWGYIGSGVNDAEVEVAMEAVIQAWAAHLGYDIDEVDSRQLCFGRTARLAYQQLSVFPTEPGQYADITVRIHGLPVPLTVFVEEVEVEDATA